MQMRVWLNHVSPIDLETAIDLLCIITKKGILYNPDCVEGSMDLEMTQDDVMRLLSIKGVVVENLEGVVYGPKTTPATMPPKPKPRYVHHRSTKTFKLESEDLDKLIQFCKDGQQRYQPLVEFYQENNNKPTTWRELSTHCLFAGKQNSFEFSLNSKLLHAGYKYAFKCTNPREAEAPSLMCFAIME
jgi:hypothetical protein